VNLGQLNELLINADLSYELLPGSYKIDMGDNVYHYTTKVDSFVERRTPIAL
jgi:hypothetical protein